MAVGDNIVFRERYSCLRSEICRQRGSDDAVLCVRCSYLQWFRTLLRRFENAPPDLVALLKMPQSDATGRAGRSKLYRRLYGILWVSCARIRGQALLKL